MTSIVWQDSPGQCPSRAADVVPGIVLVNYKAYKETIDYVRNELTKISIPWKLVVVNNAGDRAMDGALAEALGAELLDVSQGPQQLDKQAFVIAEPMNVGYARGNNIGAEFLVKYFDVDWLLITNNDIVLMDFDVVERLVEYGATDPTIGVIGPRVVGRDGRDQSPHRYMSIWSLLIIPRLLYPLMLPFLHAGYFQEVIKKAHAGYCYRIMGCFFAMRSRAFLECEGFDPETFLYAEEQILSERMLRSGYKVYYMPSRAVLHNHGQTTAAHHRMRHTRELALQSLLHYYKNYRRVPWWVCRFAKWTHRFYHAVYEPVLALARGMRVGLAKALMRDENKNC